MRPSSTHKERKSKIPYVFIAGGALVLAVAAGLLLRKPTPASATPSFLGVAESQYPFIVGSRIDTCTLCHMSTGSPSASNLNPYGTAFLNNGLNAAALVAIENMDSDGDGFTNIQELRALTFPGDPNDHPQAATATSIPTSVPTTAPTNTATSVPTTAPSNTPTSAPTIGATATGIPTIGPTATGIPTATASSTPIVTGTTGPTTTETLTPVATGTLSPTTAPQCQESDEHNEHFKKSHGKSEEQMAAADEEASEAKVCEKNEGSEVEEEHESAQAELHEHENQGSEENVGEQENFNEQEGSSQQDNENQQEGSSQQSNESQQEGLTKDQSFTSSIDLWLSQWYVVDNTRFLN